jgi:sugar phosphate isomerase/epimerase
MAAIINPVTLFTGQWDDYPIDKMAKFAKSAGFQGLELACWGGHFDVRAIMGSDGASHLDSHLEALNSNDMGVWAVGSHLVGQGIAARHAADPDQLSILPDYLHGETDEEVRVRCADEMMLTAQAVDKFRDRAISKFGSEKAGLMYNVGVVTGFTGSPIWDKLYRFPPISEEAIEAGYQEVAERMGPILDEFHRYGLRFGLEVHPTEIAFDTVTARRILGKINRNEFGVNGDVSHLGWQGIDYIAFTAEMTKNGAMTHSHMKDVAWDLKGNSGNVSGSLGGNLPFGHEDRYWDFRSIGRGMIDNAGVINALTSNGYTGPLSIEWEDALLKKEAGAIASSLIVRGIRDKDQSMIEEGMAMYQVASHYQSATAFDSAFAQAG